jgi:ATP-dependent exoDNAse (exonuclease V) beta subunit
MVKQLAEGHRNLCVVGDEDQSIYSWRGADIANILSFEKDFPETQVIKLEQNYRSTKTIVAAASSMIQNNQQRKGKVLFTENDSGDKITLREERNEYEEARYVVERIEGIMKARPDRQFRDFAVFYRTNAQSRVLEDLLRGHSVPYKLVGGIKFYARKEVKDIISNIMANEKKVPRFLHPGIFVAAKYLYKIDVEQARPIAKITVLDKTPLLFLHGGADTLINPHDSEELAAMVHNAKRIVFPEIKHVEEYKKDPVGYLRAVEEFFNDNLK